MAAGRGERRSLLWSSWEEDAGQPGRACRSGGDDVGGENRVGDDCEEEEGLRSENAPCTRSCRTSRYRRTTTESSRRTPRCAVPALAMRGRVGRARQRNAKVLSYGTRSRYALAVDRKPPYKFYVRQGCTSGPLRSARGSRPWRQGPSRRAVCRSARGDLTWKMRLRSSSASPSETLASDPRSVVPATWSLFSAASGIPLPARRRADALDAACCPTTSPRPYPAPVERFSSRAQRSPSTRPRIEPDSMRDRTRRRSV